MVESLKESRSAGVDNFKGYRTVTTTESCSMVNNNLTGRDGVYFAVVKNTKEGGNIQLYDQTLVAHTEDNVD